MTMRNKPFSNEQLTRFIIFFYVIGIIGMVVPFTHKLFIALIPWSLLMNLMIIYLSDEFPWTIKRIALAIAIMVLGYTIELIGIHTGFPFGHYSYAHGLGWKVGGVPLIIGVNWYIMIYLSSNIAGLCSKNRIIASLWGACFMLLYDVVLEAIAPKLNMWFFQNSNLLNNYIAWFIIGFLFNLALQFWSKTAYNKIAALLYVTQILFFLILIVVL